MEKLHIKTKHYSKRSSEAFVLDKLRHLISTELPTDLSPPKTLGQHKKIPISEKVKKYIRNKNQITQMLEHYNTDSYEVSNSHNSPLSPNATLKSIFKPLRSKVSSSYDKNAQTEAGTAFGKEKQYSNPVESLRILKNNQQIVKKVRLINENEKGKAIKQTYDKIVEKYCSVNHKLKEINPEADNLKLDVVSLRLAKDRMKTPVIS